MIENKCKFNVSYFNKLKDEKDKEKYLFDFIHNVLGAKKEEKNDD